LEDTDGDGRADRSRDVVAGLNLASGLAFGYQGVFVMQPPFLLFYADRDRDDRPDGDPEVLLSGFGIEDAHSVANSLTWGPDGWLYGLQGSTVTAKIRGIEFQQGVWRYHPRTRRFELFCEGGGNMWGLDFDRHGQLFASTNVGGFVMLHGVPGAYYWKSFGKHGPLHNPFAFGYFDHVHHAAVTGGHVSVRGVFYEADALPEAWRGRYIAADLLDHSIHGHDLARLGATFQGRQIEDLLRANDTWFAPSDLTLGPDGALYVADWHDKRTAHPDPDASWDRTDGRIFAITARAAKAVAPAKCDLTTRTNNDLAGLLGHRNAWYRRKARRMLAERRAVELAEGLRRTVLQSEGSAALEALWALHGAVGLDEPTIERLLEHRDADVRAWAVRLLGDESDLAARCAARLVTMAAAEPDVTVRASLACTARRLPPASELAAAFLLLVRDLDSGDPHLPLLLWWAVEHHAVVAMEDTLERFTSPEAWRSSMIRAFILGRLVRRYALEGTLSADSACARLLASAPSEAARRPLLAVLDEAAGAQRATPVAAKLVQVILDLADKDPHDPALTRLAARLGNCPKARARARSVGFDRHAPEADRLAMLDLLGDLHDKLSVGPLLDLATDKASSAVVSSAALAALGRFEDESIATTLLTAYRSQGSVWRARARELLFSRASWARAYLRAIDRHELPANELTLEEIGRFAVFQTPELSPMVRKHWGLTRGLAREEKLAEVRRLNNDLRAARGDFLRGRVLFRNRCSSCHRLHGEGATIGPDLTFANRNDREVLLLSLVDPARVVRKEYQAYDLVTRDERVFNGLVIEETPQSVMLCNSNGERTRVARSDVAAMKESVVSLMPESLYKELDPQQLRDLFCFLQSEPPGSGKEQP
jgi:putative membrane-bound dehydrogenase-like protein